MLSKLQWLRWSYLVPVVIVLTGWLMLLVEPALIAGMRNSVFDQFQRWHPREMKGHPVVIIDVDDESLRRLGQWPWPRTRLADLVDRLQSAQAGGIAFDMVFSEPDRTSPSAMLEVWAAPADIRASLGQLPDHDVVMARAIRGGRVVLGLALDGQPQRQPVTTTPKAGFVAIGPSPLVFVPSFSSAVLPLPAFVDAAAGLGALNFVPDGDGVVRRAPMLMRQGEVMLPGLAAEAIRIAQGAKLFTLRTVPDVGLESIRLGQLTIPTTEQGEVWIHFSEPRPERFIPAWKLLGGMVAQSELAGKVVLIGTSAQGLMDLRFSPMGRVIPGVEVHAQAIEQIYDGVALVRPGWAVGAEALALAAGTLLVGMVAVSTGAIRSGALFLLLLTSLWAASWWMFLKAGLLLDPVLISIAMGACFLLSSGIHHVSAERRQRWIREAFSRYVSPNLVKHLIEHPLALSLGGRRQQCSFVFTDLAGFTTMMENMDPGHAVTLLNGYLDGMIEIAFSHEGTLDRIVGDAVAIVFSAPLPQTDHEQRALRCALDMQAFAHRYAAELQSRGIDFGQTRIGVHTGEVIVGNFGGKTIFDYRALGDAVNTTSRLEGANRYLGTLICVSQAILDACPGVAARPVGRLILKGKSQALAAGEPVPEGARADPAYLDAYQMLCNRDPRALQAFEKLANEHPSDDLYAMHLERLRRGETGDLIELGEK